MPGTPHRSDADQRLARLVDLITAAVAAWARGIVLGAFRSASGSGRSAQDLISDQAVLGSLVADLSVLWYRDGRLFDDGLLVAGEQAAPIVHLDWLLNEELFGTSAAAWAQQRSAWLVSNLIDDTRAAIQRLVSASFTGSLTTQELARRILAIPGLGLATDQVVTLLRYGQNLVAAEGALNASVLRAIDVRFASMLEHRALRIAWTEAAWAANAGFDLAGRTALDLGLIEPGVYGWRWMTRSMQPCPRCLALDGTIREISGGLFIAGSYAAVHPPLHPWCQCALEFVEL